MLAIGCCSTERTPFARHAVSAAGTARFHSPPPAWPSRPARGRSIAQPRTNPVPTTTLPDSVPTWHRDLADFLGFVRARATNAHRSLRGADREDAVAEVVADVAVSLARLSGRRPTHRGLIRPLTDYAIRHRAAGRRIGTPTNRQDLQSPARRNGARLLSLDSGSDEPRLSWRDVLPDSRQADPADIAAARIDVASWLSRLPERLRDLAEALAAGHTPSELARRFGVSPGRISQMREELRRDWANFSA